MNQGKVFNIQHFSIHDGPGIRTTVFFKGCPLNCWWCHNPESMESRNQLIYREMKCIRCGDCIATCPAGALSFNEQGVVRSKVLCTLCGRCAEICPTEAMEMVGKDATVEEIMKEIEKDQVFYQESGGGVTFSGGEPFMQPAFLKSLLAACKRKGLHTAVDTSGYAAWETIESILDLVDLFLYDIKHLDEEKHKKYTGVSNRIILENLKKLARVHPHIWIRVPVIPGINDDDDHIRKIGAFVRSLNVENLFLLPYHNIAAHKYSRLGKPYLLDQLQPVLEEKMEEIREKLIPYGIKVKIGG